MDILGMDAASYTLIDLRSGSTFAAAYGREELLAMLEAERAESEEVFKCILVVARDDSGVPLKDGVPAAELLATA